MANKYLFLFFIMAIFAMTSVVTPNLLSDKDDDNSVPYTDKVAAPYKSMRGFNYLVRETATCDKFPEVCQAKGSTGPNCCKKKCVNFMADNLNCGWCGRRCWYGQTCCGGNCIDVMFNQWNCGACKNKCKNGSFCNFGMCSYA